MRIAGLIQDSIVDGPGLRYAVYVQGCGFNCEGCHNPETWDPEAGTEMPVDKIIKEMLSNPLTDGLTLSGGEPFDQASDCLKLAAAANENGLKVWIFTGRTFEELLTEAKTKPVIKELLDKTDVIVDGRFLVAERTHALKWCGSKNQKVINARKSLISGKGELYCESKS